VKQGCSLKKIGNSDNLFGRCFIGGAGIGNFGAYLSEGDTTDALFGPGLLDSRRADVHLADRTQGDAIPGLVREQASTFDGGCPPNRCANIQFSAHEGN
jgi:hypothetical protein